MWRRKFIDPKSMQSMSGGWQALTWPTMDMKGMWGNHPRSMWVENLNYLNNTGHPHTFSFLIPQWVNIEGDDQNENIFVIWDLHGTKISQSPLTLWIWNRHLRLGHKYQDSQNNIQVTYYDGAILDKERKYILDVDLYHSTPDKNNAYCIMKCDGVEFARTKYGLATCFQKDADVGSSLAVGLYPAGKRATQQDFGLLFTLPENPVPS